MIEFEDVGFSYMRPKRYRDYVLHPFRPAARVTALEHVDLRLASGDRLAILGANGAGKTTLLKLMGGLLYPTSGRVRLDTFDSVEHNAAMRARIGYVINEERSFYWRLSGYQNLEFFGALDNLRGAELRARAWELLCHVGLEHSANTPVSNYSSGMKQRLAIARGLLAQPDILLLDEPTRSLDPVGADLIRKLVLDSTLNGSVRALAVTTNQLDDVATICNRFCMLRMRRVAEPNAWTGDLGSLRQLYEAAE
jgi:ABC-2 type transport system ATP-binding protein